MRGGHDEYVVAERGELAGETRGVVRAAARTGQEEVVRHHDAHDSALIQGELRSDGEPFCSASSDILVASLFITGEM